MTRASPEDVEQLQLAILVKFNIHLTNSEDSHSLLLIQGKWKFMFTQKHIWIFLTVLFDMT